MKNITNLIIAIFFLIPFFSIAQVEIAPGVGQIQQKAVAKKNNIWGTNVIKVCWENPKPGNDPEREWVQSSIENSIEKESSLKFQGWGACNPKSKGIRIKIEDSRPLVKEYGNKINGKKDGMVLNFTFNKWKRGKPCKGQINNCILYYAIHEFMHAVGFAHEQNRDDCNFPDCMDEKQGDDGDFFITVCDTTSIMNYCNPKWDNDGVLSPLDIEGLHVLYGENTNYYDTKVYKSKQGTGNIGMFSGDFNGDGRTDIAQLWKRKVKRKKKRISIISYLSKGNGQYEESGYNTKQGTKFIKLLSGDFNGDKKTDIAQLWKRKGKVTIVTYLSKGNGQFEEKGYNTKQGTGYIEIFTGDVNGDGKTDILQLWSYKKKISVISYISKGNGQYEERGYNTKQGTGRIKFLTGDFNGDKKDDFAQLWNRNGRITIVSYLSKGNGQFQEKGYNTKQGTGNIGLFVGDVDGNEKSDIIQLWNNNKRITIVSYLSKGDGSYAERGYNTKQGSGNTGFFIGDLDKDKKDDIVQLWRRGNRLSFINYYSNGNGSYRSVGHFSNQGYGNIGITSGDVNKDEKMDIIQVWNNRKKLSILNYITH